MSKYICYNEELIKTEELKISPENRAFSYGDGIFETIRCLNSNPLFLDKHYQRLRSALYHLKIDLPTDYTEGFFKTQIYRLLQKNRLYKGARIRLNVFRSEGGLFSPTNNRASFLISSSPLPTELFKLNEKGLSIGIFRDVPKYQNVYSQFKTMNALNYVLAGHWKVQNDLGDCIITNSDGYLIEGLSSNIFCVIDDKLITPAIETGCVNGTMRSTIFDIAEILKLPVVETMKLNEKVLMQADEVFFTNAIQGITWAVAYKDRRYFHFTATKLMDRINESVKTQID